MTELQETISNLKETLIAGELLLEKMEKAQKDLEMPEQPKFPPRFLGVTDSTFHNRFIIGLEGGHLLQKWGDLPSNYRGRAGFNKKDIRQIIKGLKILIGESVQKKG